MPTTSTPNHTYTTPLSLHPNPHNIYTTPLSLHPNPHNIYLTPSSNLSTSLPTLPCNPNLYVILSKVSNKHRTKPKPETLVMTGLRRFL